MKESERIVGLFNKLYDGSPWIDVNILNALKNISAKDAARKVLPQLNSIWQIVSHMVSWRQNVLKRVHGKIIRSPDDNYFSVITDTSEKSWKALLENLDESQKKWINFLENFQEMDFETLYPANTMNYYEHIHGIIQHDAYHLGQIVLLAKALKK